MIDIGGSPILNYNVYIDDGNDGPFSTVINNGLLLTYNTAAILPALTTGQVYRFKYSGVNTAGESALSDEVAILMAVPPSVPTNLARINSATLPSGQIQVSWSLPADNGGTPVTGYKLYLNNVLQFDGSMQASITNYLATNLNVG